MNEIHTFFEENGYYLAKGVFSPDEVSKLEIEFDRVLQQLGERDNTDSSNSNGVIKKLNVQQYSGLWMATLLHEKFLDIVEQLIGPDIVLNHTTLFEKRATTAPTPFNMHQDWSYLTTQMNTMIGGMIHVGEATEEMGCLRVYPGSHKSGRVESSTPVIQSFTNDSHLKAPRRLKPSRVTSPSSITSSYTVRCPTAPKNQGRW